MDFRQLIFVTFALVIVAGSAQAQNFEFRFHPRNPPGGWTPGPQAGNLRLQVCGHWSHVNGEIIEDCFEVDHDDPSIMLQIGTYTESLLSHRSLRSVNEHLLELHNEMAELRGEVSQANENQMISMRNELIARLETLPLLLVSDENLRQQIRDIVIEEVNDAISETQ